MRIDAHQHYWEPGRFPYAWMPDDPASPLRKTYLPRNLEPILEAHRFEGSVVVQAAQVPGEADWLLDLAEGHDSIKAVVGWVDLTSPRVGDELDRLQKRPRFKGVRHLAQDEPDPEWLLRADVQQGLAEVARRSLPFDLCIRLPQLPLVPRIAELLPELRMVIDHIAKPLIAEHILEPWAEQIARAAQCAHLYCKLSGMITEADHKTWKSDDLKPYMRHVMSVFPIERLMFGSDWPVCLLAGSWKQVLAAFTQAVGPLPMERRERLLGGTACEFYGISSQTC